jgi:hypothetical protein
LSLLFFTLRGTGSPAQPAQAGKEANRTEAKAMRNTVIPVMKITLVDGVGYLVPPDPIFIPGGEAQLHDT